MKNHNGSSTSSFGTGSRINHNSEQFYKSKLYIEVSPTIKLSTEENLLPKIYENKIILGNAENMQELPDNCIHLMISSPPYNVTKEYDEDLSLSEYLEMLYKVFKETYRVLINGGRACINVANLGRKPYIPLSDHISQMMIKMGFNMRGEIIWQKGAGAGVSMAWGSWMSASNPVLRDTHEYILIFSKGDYKRDSKDKKSTIAKEQFMEWTKSVWTMNPESAKKIGHPAPFPEELPHRLIQLLSFENDVILDPFMGSGTSAVSALKNNRKFVGYEISEEYVKLAENRILPYLNQTKLEFSEEENK
ncbi:DNA-methyltransferase [Thermoflexibacter ruber]|uniref:Methyltransferase n=1 Tax=Thermoflexibacter ruber TaxID=1003 RepID=A0A1I2AKT9_9BACT|nr:site-specific DNA-methyltransferase [Thermoflexibacter ruber]SFE43490.1 site-specific DNA-methyltransferase (adenine-specific) [Thermoflexibacter ruber]